MMPFRICLTSTDRCRPPCLAGGIIGYFFGSRPMAAVENAREMASLKATIAKGQEVG